MDIGYGYDSEDSFVDDSEAVCDCVVVTVVTYYIHIHTVNTV